MTDLVKTSIRKPLCPWVPHRSCALVFALAALAFTCCSFPDAERSAEQPPPESSSSQATPADSNGEQDQHPLDPALKVAREKLEFIRENVEDYTATIIKRERVKGKLSDHQFMFVKIRCRKVEDDRVVVPFSVYLKFLKPKSVAGREVIWVEGENNGKLIAHEGGVMNLFRVRLDPEGLVATMGQKYPITKIGLKNLVEELIKRAERERKYEGVKVQFFENAKVGDRECLLIQVEHPEQRPYFDFNRARIFIDNELNVPIRYAAWGWPEEADGDPVLQEEFTYTNVKLNVGLTDEDFDPDNPEYDFP